MKVLKKKENAVAHTKKGIDEHDLAQSLHITQQETRATIRLCVSRGAQELLIVISNRKWITAQSNGVDISIDEGCQVFNKLLAHSPELEFPRFGVRNRQTNKVSYEREVETARLWIADQIRLTQEVIDTDLSIRRFTTDELSSMIETARAIELLFQQS
jgi:hypothetical protein